MEFRCDGWVCWQARIERLPGVSSKQSYLHQEAQGMRLGKGPHATFTKSPSRHYVGSAAPQETQRCSFRKAHSLRSPYLTGSKNLCSASPCCS